MKQSTSKLFFAVFFIVFGCTKEDASLPSEAVGPDAIKLKVNVKIRIADILFENIDTKIVVAGYDVQQNRKWEQEYDYSGPIDNVLLIKGGFDYYILEVNHWGTTDTLRVSSHKLFRDRADGPAPETYLLMGAKESKRLSYYLQSFETRDPVSGVASMKLTSKVEFLYRTDGKLEQRNYYQRVSDTTDDLELLASKVFLYNDLSQLVRVDDYKFNPGNGELEFTNEATYHYSAEGLVSAIDGQDTGISHTSVSYGPDIKAYYTFSNGGTYETDLHIENQNVTSSQDIYNGELCNKGTYTYDKGINPFRFLYLDTDARNFSINNRVIEQVDYISCAFPTLVPIHNAYAYDEDGYPTHQRIHYKAGGASVVDYFYRQ